MKRFKCITMALALCTLLTACSPAWSHYELDGEKETGVTISLTHFELTDTNLVLDYTIKNNTDHDVWICDSLSPNPSPSYEYFLSSDNKTLVVRKRFYLPMQAHVLHTYPPLTSRYVRLSAGQEKFESVPLTVPIQPFRITAGDSGNAEYATCLTLEVGYYNEDLSALLLRMFEIAENICDPLSEFYDSNDKDVIDRFFGGWKIANSYKLFPNLTVQPGGDEIKLRYFGKALNGEKVLRLTVDGVSIPYKSNQQ